MKKMVASNGKKTNFRNYIFAIFELFSLLVHGASFASFS